MSAQVAFVRDRCCPEILVVVDAALEADVLEGVYGYPAAIAFALKRHGAAWLNQHLGTLTWQRNHETPHERWLGSAYCALHSSAAGIAIIVDT